MNVLPLLSQKLLPEMLFVNDYFSSFFVLWRLEANPSRYKGPVTKSTGQMFPVEPDAVLTVPLPRRPVSSCAAPFPAAGTEPRHSWPPVQARVSAAARI